MLKMESGLTRLTSSSYRPQRPASEEAPWLGRGRFSESFWSNPKTNEADRSVLVILFFPPLVMNQQLISCCGSKENTMQNATR